MSYSNTVKIQYNRMFSFYADNNPQIIIREGNIFDIAKEYHNPVIHNFAHNTIPGGQYSVFSSKGKFIEIKEYGTSHEDKLIKYYRDKIFLPKIYYPIVEKDNIALLYSTCGDLPAVISSPLITSIEQIKSNIHKIILMQIELIMYTCCLNNNTLIISLSEFINYGINLKELAYLWRISLKQVEYKPIDIVFVMNKKEINNYDKIYDLFMDLNY